MDKFMKIGFIGAGKIVSALAGGLIRSGAYKPKSLIASDPILQARNTIQKLLQINTSACNLDIIEKCDAVVIGVKPDTVIDVLNEMSARVDAERHVIISIAAGIKIATIEKHLPDKVPVIRAMPNTSSGVMKGATVYSTGRYVTQDYMASAEKLFSHVGLCLKEDEKYLDVITGLSGCGPSYMYLVCEALSDGGVKAGLPKELCVKLVAQTMLGAANMVLESGKHTAQLKDDVCSPGGTSIQAIHSLEKAGIRGILMDAVDMSCKRSKELAESYTNSTKH